MFGGLIVTLGLMGQLAADDGTADPFEAPTRFSPHAEAMLRRTEVAVKADRERSHLAAKRREKKAARYVARTQRETAEMIAAQKMAEAQYKEWKSLLPYALENQRQMLDYQVQSERNRVLNRAAGAMERQAGYAYPGQSPVPGPRPVTVTNDPYGAYGMGSPN